MTPERFGLVALADGRIDLPETAQAPNVVLKQAGAAAGGSAMIAYIRGIGQTDFNYALDPGVGVYVDDVYYPTLTGSLLELLDLDRVEILRGPQGTLAGKNSIGGAIKLFSAKPDGDDDGSLSLTYGEFDRTEVRGSADFTLVEDKLFASVAGLGRTVDGYVTQYDYACTHPGSAMRTFVTGNGCVLGTEGGQSLTTVRGALRWVASPSLEFTLIGDATNEDSEVRASVLRRADGTGFPFAVSPVPIFEDVDGDGSFTPGTDIPHDCRFVPHGANSCDTNPQGKYANYATYSNEATTVLTPSQNQFKPVTVPPVTTFNDWGMSLHADWELAPNLQLQSITAYREYTSEFAEATDLSPLSVVLLLQRLEHEQFQQEIRLNGSLFNDAVDYTVGGFYFDQDGTLEARVTLDYVALDFIHGPDTTPSTNKSLFLSTTWHVTDRLDLTGGIRYSEDEKIYTFQRHNPDGSLPSGPCMGPPGAAVNPVNCAVFGVNGVSSTFQDERFDYRAVASYNWTDSIMTYAQYSTGYKSGGVNPRPFVPDQAQAFNPEELEAYELGFKTFWFDRRLRLNGAVFFNKFTDIQLSFTTCPASSAPIPCVQPQNAGDADVNGFELEAELQPVEGLIIDASLGIIDFEYTEVNTLTGINIDNVPPYTPETTWAAGMQYEFQLGDMGSLTPRIDVSYQSDIYSAPANAATSLIEDYTLWNARLTYRSPDNDWIAALEVKNLTDEYYFLTVFDQPSIGYTAAQPGWPRTVAFTLTRNF